MASNWFLKQIFPLLLRRSMFLNSLVVYITCTIYLLHHLIFQSNKTSHTMPDSLRWRHDASQLTIHSVMSGRKGSNSSIIYEVICGNLYCAWTTRNPVFSSHYAGKGWVPLRVQTSNNGFFRRRHNSLSEFCSVGSKTSTIIVNHHSWHPNDSFSRFFLFFYTGVCS